MAFYAEQKRRMWLRINGENQIHDYSTHLYNQWYNSLTEEEKQARVENLRLKREHHAKELRELLNFAFGCCSHLCNDYDGIYDRNGFPKD